jgi:hypothetical protein
MSNEKVIRGLVLVGVALFFGVQAATYRLGTFANPGAGLFPLLISGCVGAIGVIMVVRSRFEEAEAMSFGFKNILIVLASLVGFVLIADYLKMIAAVVYLVFVSTLAGADYSVSRNVKICVVLLAIAFAFYRFLGLNLPLY